MISLTPFTLASERSRGQSDEIAHYLGRAEQEAIASSAPPTSARRQAIGSWRAIIR